MLNLFLISNSTNFGESYLSWTKEYIKTFCNKYGVKSALFIPYAGINIKPKDYAPDTKFTLKVSYDAYELKVSEVFNELGIKLHSIHHHRNPIEAVINAECIVVGGGNTFHLVYMLHKTGLMEAIRERTINGTPYIGWSAGSNIACPTMKTTNDMPVIEPESLNCLNLVPFQINPHYTEQTLSGHGGETRRDRILEFLAVNRNIYVVGLKERCILHVKDDDVTLIGPHTLKIFKYGMEMDLSADQNLNFLMKK